MMLFLNQVNSPSKTGCKWIFTELHDVKQLMLNMQFTHVFQIGQKVHLTDFMNASLICGNRQSGLGMSLGSAVEFLEFIH
jgi:hypothetical protein